jgi:hypothetical protein
MVLLMSACATIQTPSGVASADLSQLVVADVASANAVAIAGNDSYGIQCYPVLAKYAAQAEAVANAPAAPQASLPACTGLICAYEVARVKGNAVHAAATGLQAKIQYWKNILASPPVDLVQACAPMVVDTHTFVSRLNAVILGGQ